MNATTSLTANSSLPACSDSIAGRALVLGGGGSTGNAWLIGVIAGLSDSGLDVTQADLIVGTSAGSTAAAQITGALPPRLFAEVMSTPIEQRPGAVRSHGGGLPTRSVADHLRRLQEVISACEDSADMRRRMSAMALAIDAASDGSWSTQWRETVAARLPRQEWPQQAVMITAVDARTGEAVVFDRDSGVDIVDAVAASCAGGPPYRIGDDRYIDGGYRSNPDNADLAFGHSRVLVLSPLGGRSLAPPEWGMSLAAQVDELRAKGSEVLTISPDSASEHLFGENAMDVSMRPPAAQAGYDQGRAIAERVADFWRACDGGRMDRIDTANVRRSSKERNGGRVMSNLILAIEHWVPGAAPGIYEKFARDGRGLPDSVRVLGSWTDTELTTCWQVMEGATEGDLAAWREHWSEFMDIEIRPVITGAEAKERAGA